MVVAPLTVTVGRVFTVTFTVLLSVAVQVTPFTSLVAVATTVYSPL